MTTGREPLVCYLRRLAMQPAAKEAPDAALLGRFIAERDGAAFATLVERHGPLVLAVCRRILDDAHDAEDAFQAAFLVLARRAAAVYPREAVAAWLHGVARRVALRARCVRARQSRKAQVLAESPPDWRPDPLAELSARELLSIIDEEVRQLPEVYRLPVILCCLEGRSLEEAARLLGWTPGSVKGRLERGRARLHQRLARRGLTLSAVLTAAELSRGAGSAAVVARLAAPTVRAALAFAAGRGTPGAASAQATARAGEVVKGMALARLKLPAALLLLACLLAGGFAAHRAPDRPLSVVRRPLSAERGRSLLADKGLRTTDNGRSGARDEQAVNLEDDSRPIKVSGRVLDPGGRPFAGARLYMGYAPRRFEPDSTAHRPAYPLRATSGADGRFRFAFARAELDERYLDASRPVVVAVADGFGLDWAEVGARADNAALTLRLVEDFAVQGRILGPDRKPVAGARIVVRQLRDKPRDGAPLLAQGGGPPAASKCCRGPLPGQPRPVTTDAGGRFRLTGVGRDRVVTLALAGPGVPHAEFLAAAWPASSPSASGPGGAGVEHVLASPRSVRGVVRDKATGFPLAGVRVSVELSGAVTRTDGQGRYELLVWPGDRACVVMAQPQHGQPYFAASMQLPVKPGSGQALADFDLVSGIPVRGRVTNAETGKPPKRAVLEYYPLFPNPHSRALTSCARMMPASSALLRPDGTYGLMVLPGPGVVLVAASPRDSYAVALLDDRKLAGLFNDGGNHGGSDHSGGSWVHIAVARGRSQRCVDRYNALALIRPDATAVSLTYDFAVQPARRLPGTVVGFDGKPLGGVRVIGLTSMPDAETLPGASFTVEGLNPRRTRQLSFHHREKGLGKVVTVRGETEALTVRLEPCGVVVGRVVDRQGKPLPGVPFCFRAGSGGLYCMAQTDDAGRFRVRLVAGQKYSLAVPSDRVLLCDLSGVKVEPGRSLDLGDLPLGVRPAGER